MGDTDGRTSQVLSRMQRVFANGANAPPFRYPGENAMIAPQLAFTDYHSHGTNAISRISTPFESFEVASAVVLGPKTSAHCLVGGRDWDRTGARARNNPEAHLIFRSTLNRGFFTAHLSSDGRPSVQSIRVRRRSFCSLGLERLIAAAAVNGRHFRSHAGSRPPR